jgi:hypothetical protein
MLPHKPVGISTYDFETGSTTYDVTQMDAGQKWRVAISQATEAARKRFPHSSDRIERAYALVHEGKVVLHPKDKTATVQSSDGTKAYTVNGHCDCPDAPRAPEGVCKHKFAALILRKATVLVKTLSQATAPVVVPAEAMDVQAVEAAAVETAPAADEEIPDITPVTTAVRHLDMSTWPTRGAPEHTAPVREAEVVPYTAPVPTVPAQFVSSIKGKPFVQFAGLLTVAHQQGLLSLTERVTHVTDTYVMAEARAEFEDGRVFVGVGDSAPDNIGKEVKLHWRRLAGTRAMARALRNALNIGMVALEELD